jgi:hypothetical protein
MLFTSKEMRVVTTEKKGEEVASELQRNQFFNYRVHGLRKCTLIGAPTDYITEYLADTNQNQKKTS